jgi:potassium efflux system protein
MNWELDLRQILQNSKHLNTTNKRFRWCFVFIIVIASFFYNQGLYAAKHKIKPALLKDNPSALIDYLAQEKIFLNASIQNAKDYPHPKDEKEFNIQKKQISDSLTIVDAKIESLGSFLENANKQSNDLNQKLKYLQQLPLTNTEINIQEQVAKTENLLIVNNKTLELTDDNIELAQQLKTGLIDEAKKLDVWRAHFDLEQKLLAIKREKTKLNEQLSHLYQNNLSNENDSKHLHASSNLKIDNQADQLIKNQQIALIHYDLNALNIQKRAVRADILLLNSLDNKTIQLVVDIYKEGINQLIAIQKSLSQLHTSLNKESQFIVGSSLKKSLTALQHDLNVQIESAELLKKSLFKNLDNYQNQLKKLISDRQSLAQYSINSWPFIINKIVAIPEQFYKYLKVLTLKVYDSYNWLNLIQTIMFWVTLSLTLVFFIVLSRFLKSLLGYKERFRLVGYLYDGVLVIVQRNMPYLFLLSVLWVIFYFTSISYSNYQLLFNLIAVYFIFRVLILIARISLLERLSDVSGKDVKLYYRLKWLFLFGGWTTALMVLGHLMPLALIVQDIFNRLFMLFILAVSLVAWKSKDVIPYLLRPFLRGKKRYIKNAASLLVVLIPITLFSTAVIGLCGFVNLAWTMSGYQAYTLLVLVGYILFRGLISDILELLSEWMISSLKNGWLWIEVFLKPLDKILRIILVLFILFILFQIFGWRSDSLVMVNLIKVAQYSLVNFSGIYITVTSVIEFFVVLALFIWAAKWTREFCYRWLYKNAKDIAIRNSLSIFTQYAVIISGSFITLHVLGIDLSGISMILGGLAVGMGFGLRDFASNIVGGIILLIERPVREGDLITLGEHEGRVAHIGIRTMRVSSWDNMEVLIPNAETFNKPFTNWTLQDGIVRTVIPIKVCRSDDPVLIQQLILDVLAVVPEIVPDPPSQVFLKKIDEALIEFEVRYFTNVQIHSRVEVRSHVLFAITAQFKEAGIRPPIEPVSIEIKEGHSDTLTGKKSPPKD